MLCSNGSNVGNEKVNENRVYLFHFKWDICVVTYHLTGLHTPQRAP